MADRPEAGNATKDEHPKSPAECLAQVFQEFASYGFIEVHRNNNPRQPIKIVFSRNRSAEFNSKKEAIESINMALKSYNNLVPEDAKITAHGLTGNLLGALPVGSTLYLSSPSRDVVDMILSSMPPPERQSTVVPR